MLVQFWCPIREIFFLFSTFQILAPKMFVYGFSTFSKKIAIKLRRALLESVLPIFTAKGTDCNN